MQNLELAWVAGILEGEGCFSRSTAPGITIGMKDQDIMERLGKLIGKAPSYCQPKKGAYRWQIAIYGMRARRVMEDVLPFMGERRAARITELLIDPTWGFPESKHEQGIANRKLKMVDAIRIRTMYNTGKFSCSKLAKQFKVSPTTIHYIVTGKTYQEVIARKECKRWV